MSKYKVISRPIQLWEISYEKLDTLDKIPSLEEVFRAIAELPFERDAPPKTPVDKLRELRVENNILLVDVFKNESGRIEGVYGKGRDIDVPSVRSGSKSKGIPLDTGEYIEDPSHFVIFEEGLAVFEKNPHGPALASLGVYIQEKCKHLVKYARVARVPRGDFLERLKRVNVIRKFTLKLGTRGIKRLSKGKDCDFFTGLEEEQSKMHFEAVTVEMSMSHRLGGIKWPWRKEIIDMIQDPRSSQDILRLEIKARMRDSGEIEVMRLLKNVPIERRVNFKIPKYKTRLDSDLIFRAIYNSYAVYKRILEGISDESELVDIIQEELATE
jgi:hypothetical protein